VTQHGEPCRSLRSLWRVRSRRACRTPVIAALLTGALGCASCGGPTAPTAPSATRSPLAVSASRHSCPASDVKPRLVLDRSATPVLVPGHPTGVLICRYFYARQQATNLAGARQVARQDVTSYLASELNALPPPPKLTGTCPEFGGRSELFVFRYPGGSTARVLLVMACRIPVTNGRVVRQGLGLHFRGGEVHWPDEGLL
jgi:hypothetical protein